MIAVSLRFRTRWPVWQTDRPLPIDASPELEAWRLITDENLGRLFGSEPARRETFAAFLRAGHVGIVREEAGRWIAYGWLATPSSGPPDHLPDSASGRWWIFYCRTVEDRRGEGHYRRAVTRLVDEARVRAAEEVPVFIDTREDNLPARRAVERLGFSPRGVVTIYRIPRTSVRWAVWRRRQPHPA